MVFMEFDHLTLSGQHVSGMPSFFRMIRASILPLMTERIGTGLAAPFLFNITVWDPPLGLG